MTAFTVKDVAARLQRSIRWVYAHMDELGGKKIGGTVFFTEEGLRDALQREKRDVPGKGDIRRKGLHKEISDEERSEGVGSRKEKVFAVKPEADPYGLLA